MRFFGSIRFRITFTLIAFGVILTVLHIGMTKHAIKKIHASLVENLLETEAEYFKYQYSHDRNTPLPHSKFIRMFRGTAEMPGRLRSIVEKQSRRSSSEGSMDLGKPTRVSVIQLAGDDTPYYMFFNGREFKHEIDRKLGPKVPILTTLFLLATAVVFGLFTSRRILAPLMELAARIRDLNPERLPDNLGEREGKNEIGLLTQTIGNTMNRIKEFVEREKQFTRDASHELRTPLTIVKGAVEIIEQQPEAEENRLIKRPLARIKRSVRDMETTIETFLWLAREENPTDETCGVTDVVDSALGKNDYLLEGKEVAVVKAYHAAPVLRIPEPVLYIALTNLIRNAFYYTDKGSVTVTVEEGFVEISDTGAGIEEEVLGDITRAHVKGTESAGFGLGLAIVQRLCDRFDWELSIESRKKKGTRVRLRY